jgi:carbamoyltransferase
MYILGISAYYHDSAACLLKDGRIVLAVEEERFSRIKHDNGFPYQAIQFCLKQAEISINKIDYIAYYEKPLLKFERILETFIQTYPFSLKPFLKGMPEWINYKIKVEQTIRKKIGFKGKIFFIPHHLSHAAVSYYSSFFKKSAILTIDGVGEYQTTGLWLGKGNKIKPLKSINFPHSLGLLYSTFTSFLGFKINEDEYKLMGLAAYGKPTYVKKIYSIIDIKTDGSFKLNMDYFAFREDFQMWNKKFEDLFGKPRKPTDPVSRRDKNLASSIQKVTEEIYFKILNHLSSLTKTENLCLSGGVALNALANGKIYSKTPFKNVYIFGAAGDSGGALGSALFVYYNLLINCSESQQKRIPVKNLYFGSFYNNKEIESTLKKYKLVYEKISNEQKLINKTAKLLSQNKIIGWFQGKMEFGPRALGSRSILANPKPRFMKDKVNEIKRREQFRPFAGSILQEKVHQYFDVPEKNHWSPFMTFCFPVKPEKKKDLAAIVHQDATCRIQTVNKENGRYYKLIKEFFRITATPCILNTSFNVKGEPIVESPSQAIEDFLKTKMDYLLMEDYLISKST